MVSTQRHPQLEDTKRRAYHPRGNIPTKETPRTTMQQRGGNKTFLTKRVIVFGVQCDKCNAFLENAGHQADRDQESQLELKFYRVQQVDLAPLSPPRYSSDWDTPPRLLQSRRYHPATEVGAKSSATISLPTSTQLVFCPALLWWLELCWNEYW